ncbi:hypothetical protein D3C81_1619270 [compost metagenome]
MESMQVIGENTKLRAQLAEAHALLRELLPLANRAVKSAWSQGIVMRAEATLSASAEPSAPKCSHAACKSLGEPNPFCDFVQALESSAPVERDERADFERVHMDLFGCAPRTDDKAFDFSLSHDNRWKLWQARAALERKPADDIPDFTPGNGNKA